MVLLRSGSFPDTLGRRQADAGDGDGKLFTLIWETHLAIVEAGSSARAQEAGRPQLRSLPDPGPSLGGSSKGRCHTRSCSLSADCRVALNHRSVRPCKRERKENKATLVRHAH